MKNLIKTTTTIATTIEQIENYFFDNFLAKIFYFLLPDLS